MLAHRLVGDLRVRTEATRREPDLISWRVYDDVPLWFQVLAKYKELGSFTLLGSSLSDVGYGPLPNVEHAARRRSRRHLKHQWSLILQVPEAEHIERGDVRGQHPRFVLEVLIEDDIAILRAERIE